jgi:hypothetical protein
VFKYRKRIIARFSDVVTERYYRRKGDKLFGLEEQCETYVSILSQWETSRARRYVTLLRNCQPGVRCKLVFCPVCKDAAKRYLARRTDKLVRRLLSSVRDEARWRAQLEPRAREAEARLRKPLRWTDTAKVITTKEPQQ